MPNRQTILASFGGGCLGLIIGVVLGAILGHLFVQVEEWETKELYGFIGFARRMRGIGIGACLGGLGFALAGAWLGGRKWDRGKPRLD